MRLTRKEISLGLYVVIIILSSFVLADDMTLSSSSSSSSSSISSSSYAEKASSSPSISSVASSARMIPSIIMVVSLFAAFGTGLYCSLRHHSQLLGLGAVTGSTVCVEETKPQLLFNMPSDLAMSSSMTYQYATKDVENSYTQPPSRKALTSAHMRQQYGTLSRIEQPLFELSINQHSDSIISPSLPPFEGSLSLPIPIPKPNSLSVNDKRTQFTTGILDWA